MAEGNTFSLRIISPDRVFYQGEVTMVECNTTEGEIGVLAGHIPLTVIISPGVLTITEPGGGTKTAAMHAGFAEILQDKMTIMAEIIEWPDEIDLDRAHAARKRAEERLNQKEAGTDMMRAEMALRRSMARINTIQ